MKRFFVEVLNPAFPNREKQYRVFSTYPGDALSPCSLAFFEVEASSSKEAIANCLLGKARTLYSPEALALKMWFND